MVLEPFDQLCSTIFAAMAVASHDTASGIWSSHPTALPASEGPSRIGTGSFDDGVRTFILERWSTVDAGIATKLSAHSTTIHARAQCAIDMEEGSTRLCVKISKTWCDMDFFTLFLNLFGIMRAVFVHWFVTISPIVKW